MNQHNTLEDRLERLGSALRERPSVTDRVLQELHQSPVAGALTKPAPIVGSSRAPRPWSFVITTGAVVTVLAIVAVFTLPARSVGWEEVNQAIKSQKWIRASVTYLGGQHGTIWLSPERGLWASSQ